MGDLKWGRSGEVHRSEVAVMVFVFGGLRSFSFTQRQNDGLPIGELVQL
jgi:hypothetical protein